jgi:hypothetical protein
LIITMTRCLCGWYGPEEIEECPSCGIKFNLLIEFWRDFCNTRGIPRVSELTPSQQLGREIRAAWDLFLARRKLATLEVCQHCLEFRPCNRIPIRNATPISAYPDAPSSIDGCFDTLVACSLCAHLARGEGHADLIVIDLCRLLGSDH